MTPNRRQRVLALIAAGLLVASSSAPGATLNWDADGALPVNGGTGTWDTNPSNQVWETGGSHVAWINAGQVSGTPDNATFAGAGAVTLATPIVGAALTMPASGGYTIDLNGNNLTFASTSGHNTNLITNSSATPATVTLTTIGVPRLDGNLSVTKEGAAAWSPATNHTFTGLLTLKGGTTTVTDNLYLGAASASIRLQDTAGLTLNMSGTNPRNIELVGTTTAITTGGNVLDLTGNISGSGTLRYTPTNGTLILSGTNSYTGNTAMTAAGSTIILASDNALGNAAGPTRTFTTSSGNTIGFQGDINVVATPIVTVSSAGTGGKGSLHNFSGDNTFGGEIRLAIAGTFGSDAGTLTLTGVIPGDPGAAFGSSSRHFVKTGPGAVEIANGNNSYRGTTTVRNGSLLIRADAPIGPGGTSLNVGALGNKSAADAARFVLLGDGVNTAATDNLALLISGAFEIERPVTVRNDNASGTTKVGGANTSGVAAFTGAIGLQRDVILTSAAGGQVDFRPDNANAFGQPLGTGVISGAFNVNVEGGGAVRLAAANTFGGAGKNVTVTGGTTLMVANNGNLGNASNGLVLNNGTLKFEGVFDPSTARALTVGAGGAGFDTNGNTITFATALADTGGGITKKGLGTLTLSGVNSHNGVTVVSAGTLALASGATIADSTSIIVNSGATLDVSASPLTLSSGQTLGGNGTVLGSLTAGAGSTLTPGASPGILATGNQTWDSDGNYNWQILDATGAAGSGFDQLAIAGTLTINSGFNLNLWSLASIPPDTSGPANNFNDAVSQSWTIATTTGGISGDEDLIDIFTAANNGTGGFANTFSGTFSLDKEANDLVLKYTAAVVPEPTSFALLLAGGSLLLGRSRRTKWL